MKMPSYRRRHNRRGVSSYRPTSKTVWFKEVGNNGEVYKYGKGHDDGFCKDFPILEQIYVPADFIGYCYTYKQFIVNKFNIVITDVHLHDYVAFYNPPANEFDSEMAEIQYRGDALTRLNNVMDGFKGQCMMPDVMAVPDWEVSKVTKNDDEINRVIFTFNRAADSVSLNPYTSDMQKFTVLKKNFRMKSTVYPKCSNTIPVDDLKTSVIRDHLGTLLKECGSPNYVHWLDIIYGPMKPGLIPAKENNDLMFFRYMSYTYHINVKCTFSCRHVNSPFLKNKIPIS